MTDDLANRLRGETMPFRDLKTTRRNELLHEAADRIEKLEAALRWITEQKGQTAHPTVCAIIKTASEALEGKDD
jgi:hypothetical protein